MNFATSTQQRTWLTNAEAEKVEKEKHKDRLLAFRNYAKVVHVLGEKNNIRHQVILTAMAYARRYCRGGGEELLDKAQCEDVLLIAITALYLAGKVEEEPLPAVERRGIDMDALVKSIPSTKTWEEPKKLRDAAITFEMEFLAQINFDLLCFHPLRPALGYLEAWREKSGGADMADHDKVLALLPRYVAATYLVADLIFEHPSSVLGMASLVCAIRGARPKSKKLDVAKDEELKSMLRMILSQVCFERQEGGEVEKYVRLVLDISEQVERGMHKDMDMRAREAYVKWRGEMVPVAAAGGGTTPEAS